MQLEGCHALVSGASSGIGREFARQLCDRAATLVLVARRKERLEELRAELLERNALLQVEIRTADLSKHDAVDELIAWATAQKPAIDLLINNAGLGDLGAFATADPERLDEMMMVNMVALTRLTRGLLPVMIEQRRGAILNVSSSAGFLSMSNFAVYAATKAYVTSFSDALRSELREAGIGVTALCPGPVQTEFSKVARREGRGVVPGSGIARVAVEEVVRVGLRGLERNQAIVIPGAVMKFGMTLVRLMPRPLLRLVGRLRANAP
ncbi:MAG: SDR family NAD(P)-dependent oxidoreductase [Chthoniobacterales bacterium]